jgi:protein O-GlcNAc transferase
VAIVPTLFALALRQHQAGNLDQAEQLYLQVLQAEPHHAETLHLMGVAASQRGRHDLAIPYIEQALAVTPSSAVFHNNLGFAYKALGKFTEAAAHYQQAIGLRPDYAVAYCNLGAVLQTQGKSEEAERCLREALRLQPDYTQALTILGNALAEQGKLEEAVACHRHALLLEPNFIDAYINLGTALNSQGKLDAAVVCYQRALQIQPDAVAAHVSMGSVLARQGKNLAAAACFRAGLELQPDNAEFHYDLGIVLSDHGDVEEAIACYRRALQLAPQNPAVLGELVHQLQHICLWDDLSDLARQVVEAIENQAVCPFGDAVSSVTLLSMPTLTTPEQQYQCACQWVERQLHKTVFAAPMAFVHLPRARSKITLGFLSTDFRHHPVAYLIVELIEKLDRDRFEVFGYSYGHNDGSSIRWRLERAFDRFVDLEETSFVEAARRIHADSVDILIDLTGHTRDARTQILAYRPAPVQVNYLGYPGTMGASFMDYILVDDFIVPLTQQPFFTEKLVHLPGCYQSNDSQRQIAVHTPARPACGLPEAGFVFCCFNSTYKITAQMFEVWMALLNAIPTSALWLLETNRFAAANLRREAHMRGVTPERLVFAPCIPLPQHLARYRLADLFLDTLPYNAHTTASDALWAGCPVLTMSGDTFPARVAGSLLRAIGLPELITTSLPEYKEMALRLAQDADLLAKLRARLLANRATSPLFSGEQFARGIEQAFETMYEIYAAGEEPRGFVVPRAGEPGA